MRSVRFSVTVCLSVNQAAGLFTTLWMHFREIIRDGSPHPLGAGRFLRVVLLHSFQIKLRPHQQQCWSNRQQCRSNVWLSQKNRSTCSIRQSCFDTAAGVDGALYLRRRFTLGYFWGAQCNVAGYFPLSSNVCVIWATLDVLMCTASIWHICIMSVDRFLTLR